MNRIELDADEHLSIKTLESCKGKPGLWFYFLKLLRRLLGGAESGSTARYTSVPVREEDDEDGPLLNGQEDVENHPAEANLSKKPSPVLPFRRIWTKNVLFTLLAEAFFDFQMGYVTCCVCHELRYIMKLLLTIRSFL